MRTHEIPEAQGAGHTQPGSPPKLPWLLQSHWGPERKQAGGQPQLGEAVRVTKTKTKCPSEGIHKIEVPMFQPRSER
jgi:hypothetical protein